MEPRETGAARGPGDSGHGAAHGPLVVIVADTPQERVALAAGIPAASPVLLARDITQARQALAQLPGAARGRRHGGARGVTAPPPASLTHAAGTGVPLQLREDRLSLAFAGREATLTRLEFALLKHLLPRMGEVATFEQLSQVGWRTPYLGNGAHMHAAVGRLRVKLTDLGVPLAVEAVRGLGFRLVRHGSTRAAQEAAHR